MKQFDFLRAEFPAIHEEASNAARSALSDPRTSCFYARRVVELSVKWAFTNDRSLRMPYDDKVSALLHDPAFKRLAGEQVFRFAKEVNRLGNRAVHEPRAITQRDSVAALSALFEFSYWFARTYTRGEKPPAGLKFDPRTLPKPARLMISMSGNRPSASASKLKPPVYKRCAHPNCPRCATTKPARQPGCNASPMRANCSTAKKSAPRSASTNSIAV